MCCSSGDTSGICARMCLCTQLLASGLSCLKELSGSIRNAIEPEMKEKRKWQKPVCLQEMTALPARVQTHRALERLRGAGWGSVVGISFGVVVYGSGAGTASSLAEVRVF